MAKNKDMCSKVHEKNSAHIFLKAAMLFFTVFSIHFTFLPITPRIITLAIIVLMQPFLKEPFYFKHSWAWWTFFCTSFVVITAFSMYINDSFANPSENGFAASFNFLVFVGVFPFLIYNFFDDEMQFCLAMILANLVQSIIVLLSALTPQVRSVLMSIQDIDFSRYNYRIVGLGIAGAGGSVYLLCGFIAASYYILQTKRPQFFIMISYLLNFAAIAFVGRTGFYAASVILIVTLALLAKKDFKNVMYMLLMSTVIVVILILGYAIITSLFETNKRVIDYTFGRLNEIFVDSFTIDRLNQWNQNLPELDLQMLFYGTGVTRGITSDGIAIQHDGGYAKRYVSIGLVFTFLSYLSYYRFAYKHIPTQLNRISKMFIFLCFVIMIVIEYKEPFMYMLALPFTVLMLVLLIEKSCKNNGIKQNGRS